MGKFHPSVLCTNKLEFGHEQNPRAGEQEAVTLEEKRNSHTALGKADREPAELEDRGGHKHLNRCVKPV